MKVLETGLDGVVIIEPRVHGDERGFFKEDWKASSYGKHGLPTTFSQSNISRSAKGVLRGLHYQHRQPQGKLVSVLEGRIFDVAVDIRKNSPTFLCWHGEILSAANQKSLLIPEGFAHGFQALTRNCEIIYLHSESFQPKAEGALNIADSKLKIVWPEAITDLSERDRTHPWISSSFEGIIV